MERAEGRELNMKNESFSRLPIGVAGLDEILRGGLIEGGRILSAADRAWRARARHPRPSEYEEGSFVFAPGDTLALYSDALVESRPEEMLSSAALATVLQDAPNAQVMLDRLVTLASSAGPPSDDLTVVVLRCTGGLAQPALSAAPACVEAAR